MFSLDVCHVLQFYREVLADTRAARIKLDDGWPESIEEKGLLLLVWRHQSTRQYSKDVLEADEKSSIKTKYLLLVHHNRLHRIFHKVFRTQNF